MAGEKSAFINNIVTTHMMLVEECEKQIKISKNLVSVRGVQKCLWPHNISCSLTIENRKNTQGGNSSIDYCLVGGSEQ